LDFETTTLYSTSSSDVKPKTTNVGDIAHIYDVERQSEISLVRLRKRLEK
jgi:hypothetical protein